MTYSIRFRDALVDRVHAARAALEQRQENHELKNGMKRRKIQSLQQIIGRQSLVCDLRHESDHRHEEQRCGDHRERPREQSRHHGIFGTGQMTQHRQHDDGTHDVVSRIRHATERPTGTDGRRGPVERNAVAEA